MKSLSKEESDAFFDWLKDRVDRVYNPERDQPEGIQVTWVDRHLLDMIIILMNRIKELENDQSKRK